MNKLPENSKIQFDRTSIHEKLILPHKSGGIMKFFIAAFLAFWLCGWALGWISTFSDLIGGDIGPNKWFIIFWLCGWTLGGLAAMWYLYKIIRPSVPETLIFSNPVLVYDSGVVPFQMSFGFNAGMDMWKKLFQKRLKAEFDSTHIQTLKLREFESGNRLTIDYKNKRVDIGTGITELEREWLFNYIQSTYAFR